MLTRHCSHCLVKNKGGCSFGLFNCDCFVSFRAIGVIWGIWEFTAELLCLPFWTLCLVSYPVEPIIKTMKHHLYVDCPGVGQVARSLRTTFPVHGQNTRGLNQPVSGNATTFLTRDQPLAPSRAHFPTVCGPDFHKKYIGVRNEA